MRSTGPFKASTASPLLSALQLATGSASMSSFLARYCGAAGRPVDHFLFEMFCNLSNTTILTTSIVDRHTTVYTCTALSMRINIPCITFGGDECPQR